MRRFVALLLVILGFSLMVPDVSAHHTPNGILPGLPTPVIKRMYQRGYVTYALDAATASYPNFRTQAADVARANLGTLTLLAIEVALSNQPDIILQMPDDTTFINTCGKGAAACIYPWADPIPVYFRRALAFYDWKSTLGHEGLNNGHAMGQHEMYNDTTFTCLPDRIWTTMSCGTGTWYAGQYSLYDVYNLWNLHVPDLPSYAQSFVAGEYFWIEWNGLRQDGGAAHFGSNKLDNVSQIAIFFSDDGGSTWRWTGDICGAQFNWCYGQPASGSGLANRGFKYSDWCRPGRQFAVRPENAGFYQVPLISGFVKVAGVC